MVDSNMKNDLQHLADSYSLKLEEFGNGHYRLSNHGHSVDYWPHSKNRTVFVDGRSVHHCSDFDAVQYCLKGAQVSVDKKRGPIGKKRAPERITPKIQNLSGLKHFNEDEIPWGDGFEFVTESDEIRYDAYILQNKVIAMRAQADDLDDPEMLKMLAANQELDMQHLAELKERGL